MSIVYGWNKVSLEHKVRTCIIYMAGLYLTGLQGHDREDGSHLGELRRRPPLGPQLEEANAHEQV